ncbi:MAG: glycosyltransferase family 4 protein, partial [Gramella sp.]|nr:glycosyltransferase family 4 protein [Christiangramia sp.]
RYTAKILNICKRNSIDLIHIHDPTALTLAVMGTKLGKLPPFILSKKTSFPIKDRSRTLYKYNHPQIQKILCVSEKTKELSALKIEDHTKLKTVYHGTTVPKVKTASINLRERFNISEEKILVGTIANHIRAKNLDTWIEMINYLVHNKNENRFHFVQIGSNTDRSSDYFDKIDKLKLNKYVSFVGFVPEAANLIPQFDISLITSQSEGIPQFIYESFYHKVPVVSTNVGGIPEIIEDGINGMLTNPFEPQSLADKLIALSRDKVLGEKFAEKSFNRLIENFTTRKMAKETLAEYNKVLYGKNRTGN